MKSFQTAYGESTVSLLAVAFGAAYVCFIDVLGMLDSPTHLTVFHLAGPASALFIPALLDILLLTTAIFAFFFFSRRSRNLTDLAWAATLTALPWIALKNVAFLLGRTVPHWMSLGSFAVCAFGFFCFMLFRSGALASKLEQVRRVGSLVLKLLALAGVLAYAEAIVFYIQARHLNSPANWTYAASAATAPKKRIVWIVLDELAFRQLYEHRPEGLALPAFDQLAAQSTMFTNVVPAGMYTDIVLPSLMTGLPVEAIKASANGRRLFLQDPRDAQWAAFAQRDTVFGDAQARGYKTAAVGWYNPYCRLLPEVLSSCFWTGQTELSSLYPSQRVGSNLVHPLARLLEKLPAFLHPPVGPSTDEIAEGKLHIADFIALDHASDDALNNGNLDFLLLHMPVPHPSGIWDRGRKTFAVDHSSYIDNLALADLYLGHVRTVLESRHEWDDATVLVIGDHSWRTKLLWVGTRPWNADDESASDHGQFDDRPAYVLKLAGQQSAMKVDAPFSATRTRAMLDSVMSGETSTPGQLELWIKDHQGK